MDFVLIVSALLKLFYAVAAVAVMWWTIKLINRSVGVDPRAHLQTIGKEPLALAVYRAAVLIATALIVAHAIGG